MPKGQAPKQTLASMRREVDGLHDKIKSHDKKINSSLLLRLKRKVQNLSGYGSSERKTLIKKLDAIERRTITKKHQAKDRVG